MGLGKNNFFWLQVKIVVFFVAMSLGGQAIAGPADEVNPFIGTAKDGNTFPGALTPWGMVSVSPHNDLQAPSGYKYGNPYLYGFGHVHLSGTGCPDLGNILLMATVGPLQIKPERFKSAYEGESASPGYYSVTLKDYGIRAEMSATTRDGMTQFAFPARKGDAHILLDVSHRLTSEAAQYQTRFESHVKILSPVEAEGWAQSGDFCSVYAGNKQTVYFVAVFSKPAIEAGTWKDGKTGDDQEQSGGDVGAFFNFDTASQESIAVKVGISYVSVENARLNLRTEMPGWDLEGVKASAHKAWDRELSKIQVEGGSKEHRKIFYTALYHALIHPNVFSDVNGEYQSMGHRGVRTAEGYTRYSVFSLWDTYRTLHPLLSLFYPERQLDMAKSLTAMAEESDWLPRWELAGNETSVMVGDPSVPVLVDTYRKGIKDFGVDSAYQSIVKSLSPDGNKLYGGLKSLLQFGYIPKDDNSQDWIWGSVSMTMDYGYDYWCLAQLARALDRKDDYDKYIHLSGLYRNLFDPDTGFFRPKNRDGSWVEPFDPQAVCCDQTWAGNGGPGFVEGSAWQYLFFVPQDMEGLKLLLGGDDAFVKRLQECFDKGHYDATNEPDIAWSYLFDYVPREAWRTQKQVRALMDRNYGPGPDGLPGNDDAGTLSAWYVFSALGFYPACPGSNSYQVGSPIFKQVTAHLNKTFFPGGLLAIKTIDNSARNVYVQSILVDGVPYQKLDLTQESFVMGKTLVFTMGSQPKK